jgi:hypothetical protein
MVRSRRDMVTKEESQELPYGLCDGDAAEELHKWTRPKLQNICKQWGLKASGKVSALLL